MQTFQQYHILHNYSNYYNYNCNMVQIRELIECTVIMINKLLHLEEFDILYYDYIFMQDIQFASSRRSEN